MKMPRIFTDSYAYRPRRSDDILVKYQLTCSDEQAMIYRVFVHDSAACIDECLEALNIEPSFPVVIMPDNRNHATCLDGELLAPPDLTLFRPGMIIPYAGFRLTKGKKMMRCPYIKEYVPVLDKGFYSYFDRYLLQVTDTRQGDIMTKVIGRYNKSDISSKTFADIRKNVKKADAWWNALRQIN